MAWSWKFLVSLALMVLATMAAAENKTVVMGGDAVLPPSKEHMLFGRNLTELEQRRMKEHEQHEKFLKEHEGHEKMHAEMLLIMLLTMILAQVALFLWSRFFTQSYQTITLVGMLFIPIIFSVKQMLCLVSDALQFVRFIIAWTVFSIATSVVIFKATRKPISPTVPRMVYTYFFFIYKVAYVAGITGYFMLVSDMLGAGAFFGNPTSHSLMQTGLLVLFYALYFGVLARDFAEICASRMASSIGYYSPKGIPLKSPTAHICALCGNGLKGSDAEPSFKLSCDHTFHEFCIRGWCIVGKKQICPFCKEKVDLKAMFPSPWARQDVMFSHFLDGVRYLIVWQPAILALIQGIIWLMDLH